MTSPMTADTDARQGEYTTYAPKGETCPECETKIEPLETCRRIAGLVVRYRHTECPTGRPHKRGSDDPRKATQRP